SFFAAGCPQCACNVFRREISLFLNRSYFLVCAAPSVTARQPQSWRVKRVCSATNRTAAPIVIERTRRTDVPLRTAVTAVTHETSGHRSHTKRWVPGFKALQSSVADQLKVFGERQVKQEGALHNLHEAFAKL